MVEKLTDFDPRRLRQHVLYMANRGNSVHIGCAFSIIEILSVLYSKVLKINPQDPGDQERDYFILSKGHGAMALYACFRELNWIAQSDMDAYFADGSRLHGLVEDHLPGMEITSGSLGHGMPVGVGIALGLKRIKQDQRRVFCLVGDGELNEGTMWESALFAGHHQLQNFFMIVDANGYQAMGDTKSILDMEPLVAKLESFGFEAKECDGHNPNELESVIKKMLPSKRPKALVARTKKGHGVSFMENDNKWHYLRLTPDLYLKALEELK